MHIASTFYTLGLNKIARSAHFWVIVAMISAISIFYYRWKDFPWFWHVFVFEMRNDAVGILYFVPFVYASVVFWWKGALIAWLLAIVLVMPIIIHYSFNPESFVRNLVYSIVPLTVVSIIALELGWRAKQREIMTKQEEQRQFYISQVFRAQEDERRRIAQELHDDTIQELIVIANHAHGLLSAMDVGDVGNTLEAKKQAASVRDEVLKVTENVRRLCLDLRPSILDNMGLVPALRWLATQVGKETGITIKVFVSGRRNELSSESTVAIFRIAQEALSNIARHSNSTEGVVNIQFRPKSLKIIVSDNGVGFPVPEKITSLAVEGKLGILGMKERAKFLKGTADIQSHVGKGTSVSILVPTD